MSFSRRSVVVVCWTAGLFILFAIFQDVSTHFEKLAAQTYRVNQLALWEMILEIVIGMYVGIILVRRWVVKPNYPLLLFAFLPSLVANASVDALFHIKVAEYFLNLNPAIFGIISGVLLIKGLFNE